MNDTGTATLVTTEELLAMPEDDGVERELIRGRLVVWPRQFRTPGHAAAMANTGYLLERWLRQQSPRTWRALAGEPAFRLRRDPDTTVGIDAALITAELDTAAPEDAVFFDGAPILAVEILSPSDRHEDVSDTIHECLEAGVLLVWVIDPDLRTVTVYRPDAPAAIFSRTQELTAEPHLPGFRVAVGEIFE